MRHEIIHMKEYYPVLGQEGRDPLLTTYLPYNMLEMGRQDQKRPCLLICPGGGYSMCSEREAEVIGLHFLPAGYNVFVLNYSVAPNRFPTQLQEVAAAMELIYANAEEWNCDVSRIAIMGFSAGGHLAGHYSNSFDCEEVRSVFPQSKAVNASILCYPVITTNPKYFHEGSFLNVTGHDSLLPEDQERFSLERLVTERTPPTFLWHTFEDPVVPVMNSLLYASALADNKVPFAVRIYPFGQHGLATVDAQSNPELPAQVQWAAQWLDEVKTWLSYTF
jgi:acetyl esterase/lipase